MKNKGKAISVLLALLLALCLSACGGKEDAPSAAPASAETMTQPEAAQPPEAPVEPASTELPEEAVSTEEPEQPQVEETGSPEQPEQPQVETPETPEVPEQPQVETPETPEAPEQPQVEAPETPEVSEPPEQPQVEAPETPEQPAAPSVDLASVAQAMGQGIGASDALYLDGTAFSNLYGIEMSWMTQAAGFTTMSGTFPDEVVLIEAVDSASAAQVAAKLQNRLDEVMVQAENYDPESAAAAKKCAVVTNGNFVRLLLSPNQDALAAVYSQYIQ